jgi:hypothetical protein
MARSFKNERHNRVHPGLRWLRALPIPRHPASGATQRRIATNMLARISYMAVGGALFELESILSVADTAKIGWWTMEWWWNQPDLPQVVAFDETIRRRTNSAASARN